MNVDNSPFYVDKFVDNVEKKLQIVPMLISKQVIHKVIHMKSGVIHKAISQNCNTKKVVKATRLYNKRYTFVKQFNPIKK